MSLDKIFLILICIVAGIAATGGAVALLIAGSLTHPLLLIGAVVIIAFAIYVLWRLLSERLGNPAEDHYDGMKH
ncbi:hypothetical protein [Tateyamaria sp. ANG-S1]|uniref:hypothetical protein n=1 Tax=Tateyamaria sp. ANG-S1 TaxID=1577905 RepID=UPI00057EE951|nr:hypothetical protein [Tateyamaria sp. ANG-S1]KIC48898.1 hypothetical protein RA29_14650 [Tateyamaria sp. ANG-S1]